MTLHVPASLTDPSRKEFTVLALEDVPLDNPKFVSSDGLLIPSVLRMRRTISKLVFEGTIVSEPLHASVDRQPVVPLFSVVVYDEMMHVRGKFGPRRADGAPDGADDVWIAAVTAFVPSFTSFARTVGGLALFGLTTALLQQHLSESLRSSLESSDSVGALPRISIEDQEKLAFDALHAASSRRASRSKRSPTSTQKRRKSGKLPLESVDEAPAHCRSDSDASQDVGLANSRVVTGSSQMTDGPSLDVDDNLDAIAGSPLRIDDLSTGGPVELDDSLPIAAQPSFVDEHPMTIEDILKSVDLDALAEDELVPRGLDETEPVCTPTHTVSYPELPLSPPQHPIDTPIALNEGNDEEIPVLEQKGDGLQSPPYTPTGQGNFASTAVEVDPNFFVSDSAAVSSESEASSVDTDEVVFRHTTMPEYTGPLDEHVEMYEAAGDEIPLTISSASSVVHSLDDRGDQPPDAVASLQAELAAALKRCRELEDQLRSESEQRHRLGTQLTSLAHQLEEQQSSIKRHMEAHSDLKILLADVEHQRDQAETALASQEIKATKRIEALESKTSALESASRAKLLQQSACHEVATCAVSGDDTTPSVPALTQLLPVTARKALERGGVALKDSKAVPVLSWPPVYTEESNDNADPLSMSLPALSSFLDRQQAALVSQALQMLGESDRAATDVVISTLDQLMKMCTKQKQSLAMCTGEFRVLHATIQAREASIQVARAHNDQIEALLHPSDEAGVSPEASRRRKEVTNGKRNGNKALYPASVPLIDHIRLREELMDARMQYAHERVETAKLEKTLQSTIMSATTLKQALYDILTAFGVSCE